MQPAQKYLLVHLSWERRLPCSVRERCHRHRRCGSRALPRQGDGLRARGVSRLCPMHRLLFSSQVCLYRRWSVVINGLLLMLCRILLDLVEHAGCLFRTMANADGRNMGKSCIMRIQAFLRVGARYDACFCVVDISSRRHGTQRPWSAPVGIALDSASVVLACGTRPLRDFTFGDCTKPDRCCKLRAQSGLRGTPPPRFYTHGSSQAVTARFGTV